MRPYDPWNERKWWHPISHLAGHIVVGSILFCIVAVPAVVLAIALKYLRTLEVPEFTITVLTMLDHTILVGDCLLFVVYFFVTGLAALREMTS